MSEFETIFKHWPIVSSVYQTMRQFVCGHDRNCLSWQKKKLSEGSSQNPKYNSQNKQGVLRTILKRSKTGWLPRYRQMTLENMLKYNENTVSYHEFTACPKQNGTEMFVNVQFHNYCSNIALLSLLSGAFTAQKTYKVIWYLAYTLPSTRGTDHLSVNNLLSHFKWHISMVLLFWSTTKI